MKFVTRSLPHQAFPDRIVVFPESNRDSEAPWMAFDTEGKIAFQSASEMSHALHCMRNAGLVDVADDIETTSRLSAQSMKRIVDYSRVDPARRWCDMMRDRKPIAFDAGIVYVFLGVEGTINLIDREIGTTIGISPFSIVFRNRIDIMRNAVRTFDVILSHDVVNPFRELYDRPTLDIIYRTMISRSWANLDWLTSEL